MSDTARTPRFWALLVGIDAYRAQPPLGGCVHDIAGMRSLLVDGFGVPSDNIRVLLDGEATRDGIIDTFRSHLIDNDAIRPGDQILFHFSGHGANMVDPLDASPSGYIESLVACDSGLEGIFNIPDTTVAALLELLAAKRGDHITVVLDCCHSGSGTRNADPQAPRVRLTRPDERVPPRDLDADLVAAAKALGVGKRWRERGVPYTLLAACRDRELAQEYVDTAGGEATHYGAFTWHLIEALWKLTPSTSYAILHEAVAARVNAYNRYQMPQCEGNVDRSVFGSLPVRRDPFVRVVAVERSQLVLGAGRVHGLGAGAKLALYPADVQTLDDLPETPIARAEVTTISASRATAMSDSPTPERLVNCRAVVVDAGQAEPRRAVALRTADDATDRARAALDALSTQIERSQWVRAAADGPAEFLAWAEGDRLVLRGADDDRPLVEPGDLAGGAAEHIARAALTALEAITRFRRVSALRNDDRRSRLQGRLRLRLRRYVEGAAPKAMPLVEPVDSEYALRFDPEADENLYLVEVVNDGPSPVYANVLILNADYSVARLYPRSGGEQAISPGESLYIGHTSPDELLDVWLPDDWTMAHDHLKLVATLQPTDLTLLTQDGLDVPPPSTRHRGDGLEALLAAAVGGHRMGKPQGAKGGEDWATADLAFTVVRKAPGVRVEAGATPVGEGIVLDGPPGFTGEVQIGTIGMASRGGEGVALPPGFARDPAFSPFSAATTRGLETGVRIALTVDEAARRAVTAQTPLRLRTPGGDTLWPVAYDGEDHLLAGLPDDRGGALITALPEPGGAASRGISRTIELFLYAQRGVVDPSLGLHTVTFADGAPQYADTAPGDVPKGGRALLIVHGLGSGTFGQARVLGPAFAALGYDALLAFDYESLGTPVADSAGALAEALRRAGFGPDDGRALDVVAHSMGGLVARSMIEQHGGAAFVDRLVMAGTPNGGARLMEAVDGALALATWGINHVLGPTVGATLGWLLGAVRKRALGPADLKAGSDFLARLNRGGAPAAVPYFVLAGRGGLDAADAGRFARLAKKAAGIALDLLFGEPHDLVVGAQAIGAVQGGTYPALTVQPATCNHFDYYLDPASLDHIRGFLKAAPSR